jgi:hypothetical protein
MRIGIYDADRRPRHQNLALLKLAAWHRQRGDHVEWYQGPLMHDHVYASKVFTWSAEDPDLPSKTERGGTGYGLRNTLPDEIEHMMPDYDFGGLDYSMGFLTRGCIRNCPWCVVPAKEGQIRPHADITEFLLPGHNHVRLMDNNFLALPEYAAKQLEKIARMGVAVDFNQGLDARLIDSQMAARLASVRWTRYLRMACDRVEQMPDVARAVKLLRAAGGRYREYWCYVLVGVDIEDALERVEFLRALGVTPFAQPYRDQQGTPPSWEQSRFARWVNLKPVFKTCSWAEFRASKGPHEKPRPTTGRGQGYPSHGEMAGR